MALHPPVQLGLFVKMRGAILVDNLFNHGFRTVSYRLQVIQGTVQHGRCGGHGAAAQDGPQHPAVTVHGPFEGLVEFESIRIAGC